jgi:hypothetical protein
MSNWWKVLIILMEPNQIRIIYCLVTVPKPSSPSWLVELSLERIMGLIF